jgi:hypothetical protein
VDPRLTAAVSTNDSTTTTIATIPIPTNSTAWLVEGHVGGINKTNYNVGLVTRFAFTVGRDAAGVVTIVAQSMNTVENSGNAPFVQLAVSGTNVLVQVDQDGTGGSGWDWRVNYVATQL